MAFGEQIGNLFQLERGLDCNGVIELAAEEEQAIHRSVFLGNRLDLIAQFQDFLDLIGQLFERFDNARSFGGREVPHAAEEKANGR
jgi:hypothetical protein